MNRIILTLLILASSQFATAADREYCTAIAQAGAFNVILEKQCGFNGNVSDIFLDEYKNKGCALLSSRDEEASLVQEAINDGIMREKAYGTKTYCEENMKAYSDLVDYKFD